MPIQSQLAAAFGFDDGGTEDLSLLSTSRARRQRNIDVAISSNCPCSPDSETKFRQHLYGVVDEAPAPQIRSVVNAQTPWTRVPPGGVLVSVSMACP